MYNDCELKKMIVEVCELLETQDIYIECKEYIDHIYFLVSETSIDKDKIELHYFPKTRKMLGCKKFVLDLDEMQYQELKKKR